MKTVNLKSIVELYIKNNEQKFSPSYMKFLGNDIKNVDLKSLKSLLSSLKKCDSDLTLINLNGFYISYKIPQIGKEFDLLRLTETNILNIEYKSEHTEKIKKQLLQNKYYLTFLGLKMFLFSYVENENKLYKLDEDDNLTIADFSELIDIIKTQNDNTHFYFDDLNKKFNPSNYLISPFSKTEEFAKNQYFLTQRQEEIENNINNDINNGIKYIVLSGEAGSGKTLLTYHLAKSYINNGKNVALIHCAKLNPGHNKLKTDFNWQIESIRNWELLFTESIPEILIIDEFQRIHKPQFDDILNKYVRSNSITLILSGDGKQIFQNNEGVVFDSFEKKDYDNVKKYKLNTKIRTNEKLANFIKIMFSLDKKKTLTVSNENIDITYFDTIEEAESYIESKKDDYQYISYTPSRFYSNKYADLAKYNEANVGNAHEVIGQEFENVIVIMGEQFYYEGTKLQYRNLDNIPYSTGKMLFQQITRAINKLEIVVVNNVEVFNNLINIFD